MVTAGDSSTISTWKVIISKKSKLKDIKMQAMHPNTHKGKVLALHIVCDEEFFISTGSDGHIRVFES